MMTTNDILCGMSLLVLCAGGKCLDALEVILMLFAIRVSNQEITVTLLLWGSFRTSFLNRGLWIFLWWVVSSCGPIIGMSNAGHVLIDSYFLPSRKNSILM
jgi:hypothetical protein